MRIVMAGATGFLGAHLAAGLRNDGHTVIELVRRDFVEEHQLRWDPYGTGLPEAALDGCDAVINLGGAGVADKRWTPRYKRLIRDSRVIPTSLLAEAAGQAGVPVMLNASAVGWYGDTQAREVDESAEAAPDFLGETCREWEDAAAPAREAGTRVALLRTGHVLSGDSVMIKRLLPIFKFGLGGKFGSGGQYFPWISLVDWLRAARFTLGDDSLSGPVNLTGPTPVTNSEFVKALAAVLRRPAPWLVPGFALKIAAGEAAIELLRGARVRPAVLLDAGFEFTHSTVAQALTWAVNSR